MTRRLALALLVLAPGCLTVRGSVGPVFTPRGQTGMDAAVTVGAGGGLGPDHGWFVTSKIGFALAPVEKEPGLVVQAGVDYVAQVPAPAFRAGLRAGVRPVFGDEADGEALGYGTVGAAVAVFPWRRAGPRHDYSREDKLGSLFGHQRGYHGLGVELGLERLFADGTESTWLIGLALVFDMTTLPD